MAHRKWYSRLFPEQARAFVPFHPGEKKGLIISECQKVIYFDLDCFCNVISWLQHVGSIVCWCLHHTAPMGSMSLALLQHRKQPECFDPGLGTRLWHTSQCPNNTLQRSELWESRAQQLGAGGCAGYCTSQVPDADMEETPKGILS